MARRRDPNTPDLFSWEPERVAVGYGTDVAGRGALDQKICRLIGRALRDARDRGVRRAEIAQAVTKHLGRQVAPGTIDKWASEGSTEHRIPLDAFIALIQATEANDLLGFVPSLFGFAVVPERYVELIELMQIEEHEKEIAARKTVLQARVRGRR